MTQRLFLAIWPTSDAVAAIQADLSDIRPGHPDLRWQPPERWHITLAFLGPADAARTVASVNRLLGDPPVPAPLRTQGAGTFGPVLWLGVEHGPWLADLAHLLQRGLRVPDARFRGHVTVARGRGPLARASAGAAVPDLAQHAGPAWTPDRVTLVASQTGPAPRYDVLTAWPMPGSPRAAR